MSKKKHAPDVLWNCSRWQILSPDGMHSGCVLAGLFAAKEKRRPENSGRRKVQ
jgi:hypothetical protein